MQRESGLPKYVHEWSWIAKTGNLWTNRRLVCVHPPIPSKPMILTSPVSLSYTHSLRGSSCGGLMRAPIFRRREGAILIGGRGGFCSTIYYKIKYARVPRGCIVPTKLGMSCDGIYSIYMNAYSTSFPIYRSGSSGANLFHTLPICRHTSIILLNK